jgi:hypothetical protein
MSTGSNSLVIPLTFSTVAQLQSDKFSSKYSSSLLEVSCSAERPSALVSWGLSGYFENGESSAYLPSSGAVLGCEDGTLYIFHSAVSNSAGAQDMTFHTEDISIMVQSSDPSPPSPLGRGPPPHRPSPSTSSSVSGFNSPFHIASHSRVVSGITAEKVEAPKNYINFEDEPDKLKDILKGRTPKDKIADGSRPASEKSLRLDKPSALSRRTSAQASAKKSHEVPKSLLSATNSPAFTPKSLSRSPSPLIRSPASPSFSGSQSLSLRCHVIPPRTGPGRSITGLRIVSENGLLVALQETG